MPRFRNAGLVYLLALAVCLLLDFGVSGTLSFIDLAHPAVLARVIRFEDLIAYLTSFAIVAAVPFFFFASQRAFNRVLVISALLSTLGIFLNIAGLLRSLVEHQVNPVLLLFAAAIVYVSNVLVFSVWYWLLDFRSQRARSGGEDAVPPVLVFPQNAVAYPGYEAWTPGFIDYLFLSFHTSSTVGPTDTLVLAKRTKIAMICQVSFSLVMLVVLAARAIGILR